MARVAFALRQAGKVGLVAGEEGAWLLVRVESVRSHARPWDEALAHRIKTAVVWEAEQRRLDQLASPLRRSWPVRIFPDRLAAIQPCNR